VSGFFCPQKEEAPPPGLPVTGFEVTVT